jgi:hypothetical protein
MPARSLIKGNYSFFSIIYEIFYRKTSDLWAKFQRLKIGDLCDFADCVSHFWRFWTTLLQVQSHSFNFRP